MAEDPDYSDYIIYVDESGDHSLTSIDPDYPIFVLAFCIAEKGDYAETIVPAFQRLKFDFFGHDMAILHAHEIRKAKGDFAFLVNAEKRKRFYKEMNQLISDAPVTLVATVIRKHELIRRYSYPESPYNLSLRFCMERAFSFLWDARQKGKLTHVVVESRGKKEDAELDLEFRRVAQNAHSWDLRFRLNFSQMHFDIKFADKQANSTSLQLADLVAQPIGRRVLKPDQPNRAFEIIEPKFLRDDRGRMKGWGLKIFP